LTERERAMALRDQVMKTWDPPFSGMGSPACVAQTSVMQTLAFVYGVQFLPGLTIAQDAAIRGGVEKLNQVLVH
jgi:hypothetical protein